MGASGNVGRTLLRQIAQNDGPELGHHKNPTVVVGLSNSKGFALDHAGFSADVLLAAADSRKNVETLIKVGTQKGTSDQMLEEVQREGYDGDLVLVDATADKSAMTQFHLKVLGETRNKMVTANKNPLSLGSYADFRELTRDPTRYKHSATAMAGLGAIPWIGERAAIGDPVHEMRASLSGTLGFISDHLTRGMPLSEAIKLAIGAGYTEPDFRDDLNGLDVARKLVILSREAGHPVVMEDLKIERFLPDEYFKIEDKNECLKAIEKNHDPVMAERYAEAKAQGKALKYLATFNAESGTPNLNVGFTEVPIDSAFGRLSGTDNRIEVVTDIYTAKGPFKLEGPGAGLEHTASVVRRDLFNLLTSVDHL